MHLLPQAFLLLFTHTSLRFFGALQPGDLPAEEPHLDDASHRAELEENDLALVLLGLDLGGNGAPAVSGAGLLDAGEDTVRSAVEAVGGDEDAANALMRTLVVELVDPPADLVLRVEVVAELDAVDELLLDALPICLDLAEGLGMVGRGQAVLDAVGLEHTVEAPDARPGVEDGPAVSQHDLGLPVATDRFLQNRDGVVHALALEESPAGNEAAVVVECEDEVETLGVDVELEDVHLDELQGAGGLEAADLLLAGRLQRRRSVAVGLEDLADGLRVAADTDAAELVVDLAGSEAGVIAPDGEDLLLPNLRDLDARGLGDVTEAPRAAGITGGTSQGAVTQPAVDAPGGDAAPCDRPGDADAVGESKVLRL